MILYKTGSYLKLIEPIEVTRVTDKSIWRINSFNGKEECSRRKGSYHKYWDTYMEAKNYLIITAEEKVKIFKSRLESAEAQLLLVQALPNK